MKTYTPDQLVILDSGQIDQVQKSIDGDALAFLDDKKEELDFLNPEEQAHLKEYYTDTMEKYRRLRLCHAEQYRVPRIHLQHQPKRRQHRD